MLYSDYKITLDVHKLSSGAYLVVKKNDTARRLRVTLCEDGEPFDISGCTAEFVYSKAGVTADPVGCTIEGNVIVCVVPASLTESEGEIVAEFVVADGSVQLTSPSFRIVVDDTNEEDVI